MQKIAIVDYGMGNLFSVLQAFRHVVPDADVFLAQTPESILSSDRIVFPGQGAMRDCMHNLQYSGLLEAVHEAARQKPMFGICVGQQMMMQHSAEGDVDCLGWYDGQVQRFPANLGLKVPHMGWNTVTQQRTHALWKDIAQDAYFYFVHSYYIALDATHNLVQGTTQYGVQFASVIAQDNVFAVQFHPEKSADNGLQLLYNFVNWKI